MGSSATGTLDEAYQRLHATGPEFDGWLSNHGPMAAEADSGEPWRKRPRCTSVGLSSTATNT